MKSIIKVIAIICSLIVLTSGCGGAGDAVTRPSGLSGPRADIVGSLASQFGGQAQMQGWVVAMFEAETNIARVAEVDSVGLFTLQQVNVNATHTIVVLSPDYIVNSVLSIPGTIDGRIRQFFKVKARSLPLLIHKGPIVSFQNYEGIEVTGPQAVDSNNDMIPDGMVSLGASFFLDDRIDLDQDGVPNVIDPDIDGDGVINVCDPDDDGDGILDVFDGDANGDVVNDEAQVAHKNSVGDQFFPQGVHYIAVQFELQPTDSGTNRSTLTFTADVREDVGPLSVQVRGAPSLLNGGTLEIADPEGTPTVVAWNRLLNDDGRSEDGTEGDRVFAQRVILEDGKAPRSHEMVFVQLTFGTAAAPWYLEFPYTFPPLVPTVITATYEPNTRVVRLLGDPFGPGIQDFVWSVRLFNEDGQNIWVSRSVQGLERQFAIQDNVMEVGKSYTFSAVAQVLPKVPGYPSYTIHSQKYPVQ